MTRQVIAGGVPIGGGALVSIQSMTITDTRDEQATLLQIQELEQAGCDIIRVSVFDQQCARNLRFFRDHMRVPLVADIHYDYRLAILSAENGADKLRINPGNMPGGDAKVQMLADCARLHGTPIRVGVNAGSLEPELLEIYGRPSPEAMVQSALGHIHLLEDAHFYDTVVSLKASNVQDMVAAYRLMHAQSQYPLHLGVTEAGLDEDALVKSAVGLGALLLDGIGDTLRVSITGNPLQEISAARKILSATGVRPEGVELISCPTCGRCRVDLYSMARQVKDRLPQTKKHIRVAVMGCAVNGPGEAREADIGIAFSPESAVVFKQGERYAAGEAQTMLELLIDEAARMTGE